MPRHVDIRPLAYTDLEEISNHIANDRPASGRRFLLAAEESFASLARNPGAGWHCDFENPSAADIRCRRVKGFKNYLIFYRPIARGAQIVRVLHGARDIASIFEQAEGME